MKPATRHRSGKFNLIDLVVLVSVVAFGAVLSTGIVNGTPAIDGGRATNCQNTLRQLTTALLQYENSHNQYPGYANFLMMTNGKPYVDKQTGKISAVSFVVPLLPLLDRPDLYQAWKTPVGGQLYGLANAPRIGNIKVKIDLLQCRSDPQTNPQNLSTSYVVNCGMKDCPGSPTKPRDWPENGIFFDHFTGDPRVTGDKTAFQMVQMSNAYIIRADGLQNTTLLSENVDAGDWTDTDEARIGMLWNPKGTIDKTKNPPHLSPPDENVQINHGTGLSDLPGTKVDAAVFARPSSFHPGGVNMAFCDGHVRFVSDKIDYYVYCLLMSTNGQRAREPCNNKALPDFGVDFNDTWLHPNETSSLHLPSWFRFNLWTLMLLVLAVGICLALVARKLR